MDRRKFLGTVGVSVLSTTAVTGAFNEPLKPNIVFILLDDLGWADVGCYGSTFYETPNIDRLAKQGVRFVNAYSACCVCSPTRGAILTGKYPARLGITDWLPGHAYPKAPLLPPSLPDGLAKEEKTLADFLRNKGYRTGIVGKWHLGSRPNNPENHGFDVAFGRDELGYPPTYFYPYKLPSITDGKPGEYLTDRLTDEAVKFIEDSRERPFFLYFAHYAVHTPLEAKPELVEKYKAKARPDQPQHNPVYAAMIESVDQSVGKVMETLDRLGLSDNTIVVFNSDNGGHAEATSNAPLRAVKGTLYEGGLRDPLIIRWPGKIKPDTTETALITSVDFLPTLLEAAGKDVPDGLDGVSLLSLVRDRKPLSPRALYWHYPHYHPGGAHPSGAIREGDFKLIEQYESGKVELYNLAQDLSEQTDLAEKMPDKAKELQQKLAKWRESVGAKMPTPNPNYDPNASKP